MRRKYPKLLTLWLVAIALIAGACGSGDDADDASGSSTTEAVDVPTGGTLVVGAEQEPDCTDWIGSCGGSSWGYWMMNVTTLPRAYDAQKADEGYEYVKSDLLTEDAELETEPKQKVTYKLNPKVKWDDGTPVTSKDFKYLWQQITTGEDIYDTTGYADIESVDDSDPETVVVTFKKNYADWKSLFGGGYGLLPSHLLEGKDRTAEIANGYKFSAGPWKIESWTKGQEAVLVPNANYHGDKPKLEKVVFKFISDTSAQFQAFKGGEVSVIFPQPQPDVVDQISSGGLTGTESDFTADTGNLEALWFNTSKAPFDDVNVRKAWAYSIERDAVVNRLFGGLGIKKASQSLNAPILEKFTDPTWSKYKKNLAEVDKLMKASNWTKGSDGIWAKDGKKFSVVFKTTTGNKRRELTQQILQEQLKAAGFDFTVSNQKAGDLFGDQLPKGDYDVALYAQVLTSISPSLCNIFCSKNIPVAPDFSGQNWGRVNISALDPLLEKVDSSLDDEVRAENQKKADKVMADNNVALPLDPLPNILLWKDTVVGAIENNAIMGPFWQIHRWGVTS